MTVRQLKTALEQRVSKTDAALLLKLTLGTDSTGLILRADEETDQNIALLTLKYAEMVQNGTPIQYLLGEWEFYGINIAVNKNVLIPRADTETLVDEALKIIKKGDRVADICTGSGCIAAALITNADCFVTAVELSDRAIKVAEQNLKATGNKNYGIIKADVLNSPDDTLWDRYDVIVSNPPYIKSEDIKKLDKNVQREPIMALDGGEDGLKFYKALAKEWKKLLKEGGKILLEIGFDQAGEVSEILENNGFCDIKCVRDSGQNDRVIIGTIKT